MLGKLIKYDIKTQMKFLKFLYLTGFIIAVVTAVLNFANNKAKLDVPVVDIFSALSLVLAIISFIGIIVGTGIYMIMRFRKNLFKDEGYLMHTIPVKPSELYLSKIITGSLNIYIAGVVVVILAGIALLDFSFIKDVVKIMFQNDSPVGLIILTIVSLVFSVPATLSQFYAALCCGYTWKQTGKSSINKDLLSILSYIIIYVVQQVIVSVIMTGIFIVELKGNFGEEIMVKIGLENTALIVVAVGFLMEILITVVFSLISISRMKKHLNLE